MGLSSKQDWSQIVELDIPKEAANYTDAGATNQQQQQKRPLLKCPRCDSTNTKFCYYNNYSKMQPRHFCRACKRHWTAGGTLRNVPVGGGHRSKRAKMSHEASKANGNQDGSQQQQQQQQQQVVLPLIDTAIFPDIFRQVLSQPPSQLSLLPPLPHEAGAATENFYSGCGSSNSGSSRYGGENMLGLMDGYNAGDWLLGTSAQPASYADCWDGMLEFDALNEHQ